MHSTRRWFLLFMLLFSLNSHTKKPKSSSTKQKSSSSKINSPSFSLTYNGLETAAFLIANKMIDVDNLIYIPLHFDANIKLRRGISLSLALIYRYEDYQDDGPLYSEGGKARPTHIWTKYNEVFLLAGPRFSPGKKGLEGFYLSIRGGLGTALSPAYFNLSALMQPEIGYSFIFGNPGFSLTLGAGVLLNMPFYENIRFAVPWNKHFKSYNFIGVLVHQATPILNLGLGFNL